MFCDDDGDSKQLGRSDAGTEIGMDTASHFADPEKCNWTLIMFRNMRRRAMFDPRVSSSDMCLSSTAPSQRDITGQVRRSPLLCTAFRS